MPALSKTAQLLRYFAQQYQAPSGVAGIPRKRLMKMAYLSDMLALEYLGEAITEYQYIRYTYGPYDEAIKDTIDEIVAAGMGEIRTVWDNEQRTIQLLARGVPAPFDFTPGQMEVMRYVVMNYLRMPMEELLRDVVYSSAPMTDAEMSKPLPMEVLRNRGTQKVGFELEAMLRAEQEIASGRFAADF
ncbi:MAG: Panacea domain-containing protein [Gemmatimonadota bacterium]